MTADNANIIQWKNPRATAITFLVNILFIFAARYLNILRYILKALYFVTGSKSAGLAHITQWQLIVA
jgi:hypothetical protein